MNNQAAQTPTPAERGLQDLILRLASVKDQFPAGSDHRKAVWQAIELLRTRPLPSDWVAVPKVATREMVEAWAVFNPDDASRYNADQCTVLKWGRDAWSSMLKAAPSAPAGGCDVPGANDAMHWIDRYASGIDEVCQLDRIAEALGKTAPEPLAQGDALFVDDRLEITDVSGVMTELAEIYEPGERGPLTDEERAVLVDFVTGLVDEPLFLGIVGHYFAQNPPTGASPQPAAEGGAVSHVTIDFPQIGTAGPFKVIDGRMTLPDVTMNDLMHHARMGYVPAPNPPQPSASVGERTRELFEAMLSAPYGGTTMGDIVCAETTRNRLESAWLPIIESALTTAAGGDEEVGNG